MGKILLHQVSKLVNSKPQLSLPATKLFLARQYRQNRAFVIMLIVVGLLLGSAYSSPLLRAYPVSLSNDVQAILVKNETRTYLDLLPEFLTTKLFVDPSGSRDPYKKQSILNAYGASLRVMGINTKEGLLIVESEKYDKGKIFPISLLNSYIPQASSETLPPVSPDLLAEENPETYLYLNNTRYPKIKVPSILTLTHGNSDTLALTLYFLEEMLHGNWNNSSKIKITGALSNPWDYSKITRIGSAEEKAAINLNQAIFILPRGNKEDLKNPPAPTFYVSDLKELLTNICSLPDKGTLCSHPSILSYIK